MDQVAAPFAQNLASMEKVGEAVIGFIIGSLVYESRNNLAKQAIKSAFDYIMFIDSDMVFDADLMPRLMKHCEEDGMDIVSGIYFRRRPPFTPVIYEKLEVDEDGKGHWDDFFDYPEDSVFEIAGCGFGCILIKTQVLMDMAAKYSTWFEPIHGFGEDLSFCLRARELGYKIYCDSSIKCGHVGQLVVDESVYKSMKANAIITNGSK